MVVILFAAVAAVLALVFCGGNVNPGVVLLILVLVDFAVVVEVVLVNPRVITTEGALGVLAVVVPFVAVGVEVRNRNPGVVLCMEVFVLVVEILRINPAVVPVVGAFGVLAVGLVVPLVISVAVVGAFVELTTLVVVLTPANR